MVHSDEFIRKEIKTGSDLLFVTHTVSVWTLVSPAGGSIISFAPHLHTFTAADTEDLHPASAAPPDLHLSLQTMTEAQTKALWILCGY